MRIYLWYHVGGLFLIPRLVLSGYEVCCVFCCCCTYIAFV